MERQEALGLAAWLNSRPDSTSALLQEFCCLEQLRIVHETPVLGASGTFKIRFQAGTAHSPDARLRF